MAERQIQAGQAEVDLGHRGHAMIAALIREWETSREARAYPIASTGMSGLPAPSRARRLAYHRGA